MQKYGRDEEISHEDFIVWQGWLKVLTCLRTISVPRCEIVLSDSERARVSNARHNLLDRFYRSLVVHS